jgi:hypothetical protein
MQQDVCNVVPVFRLAAATSRRSPGNQEASQSSYLHLRLPTHLLIHGGKSTDFDILHRQTCAAEVYCPELLATIELDCRLVVLSVQVREQLEFDDCLAAIRSPTPEIPRIWPEPSLQQCLFEARCIHRSAADLQVHLNVQICGARMRCARVSAQQSRNQAAQQNEFGTSTVMVRHSHQR